MNNNIVQDIIENMERAVIGKRDCIEALLTCVIAGGHVLLEDVPGVGKTQLALSLARSCEGSFNRLQLTPDIMPSDITGYTLIRQNGSSEFVKGAAFCNFLLADEINRCSPKSQSALLEIMEEGQVSIDGNRYALPMPFMVIATQNPVETYGTYHLPEAQLDRFLMKLSVGYPGRMEELEIIARGKHNAAAALTPVATVSDIESLKELAGLVHVSKSIDEYILRLAVYTREDDNIKLGLSPRGSMALRRAVMAYAIVKGRDYVLPDDVKLLAMAVIPHRIILSSQGRANFEINENYVRDMLEKVFVVCEG